MTTWVEQTAEAWGRASCPQQVVESVIAAAGAEIWAGSPESFKRNMVYEGTPFYHHQMVPHETNFNSCVTSTISVFHNLNEHFYDRNSGTKQLPVFDLGNKDGFRPVVECYSEVREGIPTCCNVSPQLRKKSDDYTGALKKSSPNPPPWWTDGWSDEDEYEMRKVTRFVGKDGKILFARSRAVEPKEVSQLYSTMKVEFQRGANNPVGYACAEAILMSAETKENDRLIRLVPPLADSEFVTKWKEIHVDQNTIAKVKDHLNSAKSRFITAASSKATNAVTETQKQTGKFLGALRAHKRGKMRLTSALKCRENQSSKTVFGQTGAGKTNGRSKRSGQSNRGTCNAKVRRAIAGLKGVSKFKGGISKTPEKRRQDRQGAANHLSRLLGVEIEGIEEIVNDSTKSLTNEMKGEMALLAQYRDLQKTPICLTATPFELALIFNEPEILAGRGVKHFNLMRAFVKKQLSERYLNSAATWKNPAVEDFRNCCRIFDVNTSPSVQLKALGIDPRKMGGLARNWDCPLGNVGPYATAPAGTTTYVQQYKCTDRYIQCLPASCFDQAERGLGLGHYGSATVGLSGTFPNPLQDNTAPVSCTLKEKIKEIRSNPSITAADSYLHFNPDGTTNTSPGDPDVLSMNPQQKGHLSALVVHGNSVSFGPIAASIESLQQANAYCHGGIVWDKMTEEAQRLSSALRQPCVPKNFYVGWDSEPKDVVLQPLTNETFEELLSNKISRVDSNKSQSTFVTKSLEDRRLVIIPGPKQSVAVTASEESESTKNLMGRLVEMAHNQPEKFEVKTHVDPTAYALTAKAPSGNLLIRPSAFGQPNLKGPTSLARASTSGLRTASRDAALDAARGTTVTMKNGMETSEVN